MADSEEVRTRRASAAREQGNVRDLLVTGALLALALAVGGAGLAHPLLQMLLGLGTLAAAAYFALTRRSWRFRSYRRLALALLGLMLALPLLQLIPLPPALWHALPGRDVPVQVDQALGLDMWRPLTLDVEATLRAFLGLLPAAVVFIGCLFLRTRQLAALLWLLVAFALLNCMLGLLQVISGGGATPYPSSHSGYPIGLFVNRNHHAALLLAAMPVAAALGEIQLSRGTLRVPTVVTAIVAMVLFALVIIGTTSRMALALLPLAMIAATFTLLRARAGWKLALPSILGLAAVILFVFSSGWMNRTVARFSSFDARFDYWSDIDYSLDRFVVPGAGFGTFVPVYQMAETLDGLTPRIINHAHNDYLEILLEGGIAGGALLLAFAALIAAAAFNLSRSAPRPERGPMQLAAAAGIALLLLFSVVDYPLRMPALATVFALFCALLLPTGRHAGAPVVAARAELGVHSSAVRLLTGAALILLAVLTVQAAGSSRQLRLGNPAGALKWAAWSTKGHERAATEALLAQQIGTARRQGLAALRLSPISAAGVRSVGLVEEVRGNTAVANRLLDSTARLGWRDTLSQLWVMERASAADEPVKAVQRAAALFRQEQYPRATMILLLRAPNRETSLAAIADALARNPPWRDRFLAMGGYVDASDTPAFAQLLSGLAHSPAPPSDSEMRPFVDHLINFGDYGAARRVWLLARDQRLLANGGFEQDRKLEDNRLPASWEIGRNARGLPAMGAAPSGGQGLALRIPPASADTPILWQQLLLTGGNYIVTFRAQSSRPEGITLRWTLGCRGHSSTDTASTTLAPTTTWQQFSQSLAVPIRDCPVQRLALRRTPGMHDAEIWIDDVSLKTAPR